MIFFRIVGGLRSVGVFAVRRAVLPRSLLLLSMNSKTPSSCLSSLQVKAAAFSCCCSDMLATSHGCADAGGDGGDNEEGCHFGRRQKSKDVLSERTLKVPSFGGSVCVKSSIDVQVLSAGTMEYPNLDRSSVSLLGPPGSRCSMRDNARVSVHQEGAKMNVEVTDESPNKGKDTESTSNRQDAIWTRVEVPVVHSVQVTAADNACVEVGDFVESDYVRVSADNGHVVTRSLKTANVNIQTRSGDILCTGPLQGDVKISSESGTVVAQKRFIGPNLEIRTETGDIRVASSYSDQAKFSVTRGNLNLRNVHNESYVAVYERGDVTHVGVDGSTHVFVKKGDADVQISRIVHESRVHVEDGDIRLRLNDSHPLKLSIEANDIVPDAKFRTYGKVDKRPTDSGEYVHYFAALQPNKFSPTLMVVAENGSVILESQDWAASLGLKLRPSPVSPTLL